MDILVPALILIFTAFFIWSVFGYFQNDLYPLIVGAAAELFICYLIGRPTGNFLIIVPIIQLGLAGFLIYKKIIIFNNTRVNKMDSSKKE